MGKGQVKPQHSTEKTPPPGDGEWGLKDGWFSEAGLLAATEDEGESAEAEQGGGGGLWNDRWSGAYIGVSTWKIGLKAPFPREIAFD